MALYILLGIAALCFMQFVAWSNHKYIVQCFLPKTKKDFHIYGLFVFPNRFLKH